MFQLILRKNVDCFHFLAGQAGGRAPSRRPPLVALVQSGKQVSIVCVHGHPGSCKGPISSRLSESAALEVSQGAGGLVPRRLGLGGGRGRHQEIRMCRGTYEDSEFKGSNSLRASEFAVRPQFRRESHMAGSRRNDSTRTRWPMQDRPGLGLGARHPSSHRPDSLPIRPMETHSAQGANSHPPGPCLPPPQPFEFGLESRGRAYRFTYSNRMFPPADFRASGPATAAGHGRWAGCRGRRSGASGCGP